MSWRSSSSSSLTSLMEDFLKSDDIDACDASIDNTFRLDDDGDSSKVEKLAVRVVISAVSKVDQEECDSSWLELRVGFVGVARLVSHLDNDDVVPFVGGVTGEVRAPSCTFLLLLRRLP